METILSALVALACPVGMGLMMWMMGRHDRSQPTGVVTSLAPASADPPVRLARLHTELDEVRTQQEAIASRINALSIPPPLRPAGATATVAEAPQELPNVPQESRP